MTIGERLRELRVAKGLYQRHIAAALDMDTAYVSKMESNEKPVRREHLPRLAELLDGSAAELDQLWLATKLYHLLENEPAAAEALRLAREQLAQYRTQNDRS